MAKMILTLAGNPMISVPFRMENAVPSKTGRASAHTYCREHGERVKERSHCESCGGECPETYSAYDAGEVGGPAGVIVELDTKELEAEQTKTLELSALVEADSIDPVYFESSYWIVPEKGAEKAYDQLAAGLRASGEWALGTAVLNKATKPVVLRWSERAGCLTAHALSYDTRLKWEVARSAAAAMAQRPQLDDAQAARMAEFVAGALADSFDLTDVADGYAAALAEAITNAAAGIEPVVREDEPEPETPVIDLMAALEASVAAAKKPKREKAAA